MDFTPLCSVQASDSGTTYDVFKFNSYDTVCQNANRKVRRGDCFPNKKSSKVRLSNVNPPICHPGYLNDPDMNDFCSYNKVGEEGKICNCDVQMEYGEDGCVDGSSTLCCLLRQFDLYVPGLVVLGIAAAVCCYRVSASAFSAAGYPPFWEDETFDSLF